MKSDTMRDLGSVIKAHTERRTLSELAAEGKRHVRVVSGQKVLKLIQAIVDDAIERETVEMAQKDRDRVVAETRGRFESVMKLQAEQEEEIRSHKKVAKILEKRLEDALSVQADREARLVAESMRRIEDSERQRIAAEGEAEVARTEKEEAAGLLRKAEERLSHARSRIEDHERELERFVTRIEAERGELAGRQEQEIVDLRHRVEEAEAGRAEAVSGLERSERAKRRLQSRMSRARTDPSESSAIMEELECLRTMVRDLSGRPAGLNEDSVHTLMARLSERDDHLEGRFSFQMDQTIDEITRALHRVTAKPIDFRVEATDILVDRVFDSEAEMMTNLDVLTVEELTSEGGISGNLELLKAAREGSMAEVESSEPVPSGPSE